MQPLYAFVAGIFLVFIGFPLLNGLSGSNLTAGYIGLAFFVLGIVLVLWSLIVQAKKSREEGR